MLIRLLALAWLAAAGLVGCRERAEPGAEWAARAAEGEHSLERGRLAEATAAIDEAEAELARAHPGTLSHGRALIAVGRTLWYRQQLEEAVAVWERALEIVREHAPEGEDHARLLDLFGVAALRFDHVASAEDYFRQAYDLRRARSPDPIEHLDSLERLSQIALAKGELAEGERLLLRAKSLRESLPEESLELAEVYYGLGMIARKRGQKPTAAQWHERGLEIRRRLAPDSPKEAASLRTLAGIALERGNLTPEGLAQVRSYYEKTIDIWDQHGDYFESPVPLTTAIVGLGKVAFAEGDLDEAVRQFEAALQIAEENPAVGRSRQVKYLSRLGAAHQRAGRHGEAAEAFRRALDMSERLRPGSEEQIQLLGHLGRYARLAEDYSVALEYYRRALILVDDALSRAGGGAEAVGSLVTKYQAIYTGAMVTEIQVGQLGRALDVLERYRARSFLARVTERDLLATAGALPELEELQGEIAESYDRIQIQLSNDSLSDERRHTLLAEEDELRARQLELAERVRQASPRLAAIRYPEPMRAETVQRMLEEDTLLLSYFVADRRTVLFAVTAAGVEMFEIPAGRRPLLQRVTRFRHLVLDVDPRSPNAAAASADLDRLSREIYRLLLEPAEPLIESSRRVLIVPDASLNLLPFGALRATDGEYLIEKAPLHIALSATVYGQLVRDREPSRSAADTGSSDRLRFAGFANPVVSAGASNYAIGRGSGWRGLSARGAESLEPLPYSSEEVRRIAELYDAGAVAHYGSEATEDRAKELLSQADILHFATHGIIDEVHPLDSALVFSASPRLGGERNNGLLQAWEIFQEGRLDSDLVVLSACRTGLGSEVGGEGLIGLTRAFQYAGARTVLASLWDVADQSTAELMVRFYQFMNAGQSKADALRQAQLELLRGEVEVFTETGEVLDSSSPFFWAAFQLYGDWR